MRNEPQTLNYSKNSMIFCQPRPSDCRRCFYPLRQQFWADSLCRADLAASIIAGCINFLLAGIQQAPEGHVYKRTGQGNRIQGRHSEQRFPVGKDNPLGRSQANAQAGEGAGADADRNCIHVLPCHTRRFHYPFDRAEKLAGMRPFWLGNGLGQQFAVCHAAASQGDTAAASSGVKGKDEGIVSHSSGCAQPTLHQPSNVIVKDKNHQRAEQGYADLLRPDHG